MNDGRADSFRAITEDHLQKGGIPYHHLIMCVSTVARVLINNMKVAEPDVPIAAADNVEMDQGLREVDI